MKELPDLTTEEQRTVRLLHKFYVNMCHSMKRCGIVEKGQKYIPRKVKNSDDFMGMGTGGNWSFVPNYNSDLTFNLYRIYKYLKKNKKGSRSLDVGCGGGNVLALMDTIGYTSFGIDYMKKFSQLKHDRKVIIVNALKLPQKFYYNFNLIYLYRPIDNTQRCKKLLYLISKGMDKGSIIYPYYFLQSEVKVIKENGFEELSRNILIKSAVA